MQVIERRARQWMLDKYHQDQHVELIEGVIVEMAPQRHSYCTTPLP